MVTETRATTSNHSARTATRGDASAAAEGFTIFSGSSPSINNSINNNHNHQSWWESMARARKAIDALSAIINLPDADFLRDSEKPARALMESQQVSRLVLRALSAQSAGTARDLLCQWLYETYQSEDPDLQLLVLRFLPIVAGIYLCRVVSESHEPLAGLEAVLLSLYTVEAKVRCGRPVFVQIPDLGQRSLYHSPRNPSSNSGARDFKETMGELCGPLEPQNAVKSTKRALIIGVGLDLFHRKIAVMPPEAKIEFCRYVKAWAGQDCPCMYSLDSKDEVLDGSASGRLACDDDQTRVKPLIDEIGKFNIQDSSSSSSSSSASSSCMSSSVAQGVKSVNGLVKISSEMNGHGAHQYEFKPPFGARIPLPWELMQPILKIVGHCLMGPLNPQEVKDAAAIAARALYARASHDLVPQTILATRSLLRLHIAAQEASAAAAAAMAASANSAGSNSTTPRKQRKPEVLLVSK